MGKPYIKGGTPVGSTPLCRTCTSAHIMTGYRESELLMICTDVHPNVTVPFAVYECSGYYDKNRPSWKEMKDFAIDISTEPLKKAGFKLGLGFAETAVRFPATAKKSGVDEDEDDE